MLKMLSRAITVMGTPIAQRTTDRMAGLLSCRSETRGGQKSSGLRGCPALDVHALPVHGHGTKTSLERFLGNGSQWVEPEVRIGLNRIGDFIMLNWALTFLVVALVAAVLGFGGIAGSAVEIAKIIFYVAIALFVISTVVHLVNGRSPPLP